MDAISGISEAGYVATSDQIKELGALSVGATRLKDTIGTTYLRALVKEAQNLHLNTPQSNVDVVNAAHASLYPHVLDGVTTDDVRPLSSKVFDKVENKRRALERNSRSNFARTAASTLRRFVNAGGDLIGLDVEVLTKSSLVACTPVPANEPDIGPQVSDHHAVWGGLERAFQKFTDALDKDADRANTAEHYIARLNMRYY